MQQREILAQIDETIAAILAKAKEFPDDRSLQKEKEALQIIRSQVSDHWPLKPKEKADVNIGIYAIRTMEGMFDDLVKRITTLDQALKSS